jgi:hypothetical protein
MSKNEAEHHSEYSLNQPASSNRFAVLQEEESREGQQTASHSSTPKAPPIHVTTVQNISPLIQLLEEIASEQYEINVLADI